ncbi:hypothetical protein, partial [Streptomyces sp. NPDC059970]|uniref:hypothetical protein n=1 Tax=Streptomyces sp. NPDC059970 TaxID=3347019 RepID=UPI0036C84509
VVALHQQGYLNHHIRQLTARSNSFVCRSLTEGGLQAHLRSKVDTEELIAIYRVVASIEATAEVLHLSASTVLARLRENGVGLLDAPDPDAAPVYRPELTWWLQRNQEILARAARSQNTAQIAAAVHASVIEVTAVIRDYRHRDITTAEILHRHARNQSPGVIAIRMGLRLDRVKDVLARYTSHPRRSTPLAKPPTQ